MALHADVAELLAAAGVLGVDVDDAVADEHVRWSAYRRVVLVIASSPSRDRDVAIVATILRDPVEMVAKSAVVAFVDEIAMRTAGPAEFRVWASGLLPEIDGLAAEGHRAFIRRPIHDWLFHLSPQGRTRADNGRVGGDHRLDAARPRRGVEVAGGTRPARRVGPPEEDAQRREEPGPKSRAETEMNRCARGRVRRGPHRGEPSREDNCVRADDPMMSPDADPRGASADADRRGAPPVLGRSAPHPAALWAGTGDTAAGSSRVGFQAAAHSDSETAAV